MPGVETPRRTTHAMGYEHLIGYRYLRARQSHAFISLISLFSVMGVTVGVMALIVVIAVMAGFENDLKSRIIGVESHLVVKRADGDMRDHQTVLQRIKDQPETVFAAPFVHAQTLIRSAGGTAGALVRGIDPHTPRTKKLGIDLPSLLAQAAVDPTASAVVLGMELAQNLGVLAGDTVYLVSPKGMISPVGHLPAMRRFTVSGVFQTGMYEYDSTLAYIGLADARRLMRLGSGVTGVEAWLRDMEAADAVAGRLSGILGDGYRVTDWAAMNANFFFALKLEKTAMFTLLTLIVLVAAFNIAGSLVMMVIHKTRDIAILKAMGATNAGIRRIFIFQGAAIGVVGTTLGVLLGTGICLMLKYFNILQLPADVYYITRIPVVLDAGDVILIGVSAIAICFFATLYPAQEAARSNPVDALRRG